MKKGFISISIIYTFLIAFLAISLAIISSYVVRYNYISSIVNDARAELSYENK